MGEPSSFVGHQLLREADDITAFLLGATGMQPEYMQLSRGPANLRYRWIDLDGVVLLWGHSQAHAMWRDQMAEEGLHFGYVVSSDRGVTVCGKDIGPDYAMVWRHGEEMEYTLPGNVKVIEIGVEQHILDELGWRFGGAPLAKVSAHELNTLTRTCTTALQFCRESQLYRTQFRERILDWLERILEPWMQTTPVKKVRPRRKSIAYSSFQSARAILETMELDQKLRVEDLSQKLGVPRSTLHYTFRQSAGIGPRRYFELLRLHKARKALRSAQQAHTTIAAVATAHGFSDFGRFSKLYFNQFGELPSTTLGNG